MKGYEKIEAIINQAHSETTNPVVALVAASAQAMRSDDCQVTVGSGATTNEAVSNALARAGRMKDFVVVVSKLDADGSHVLPAITDQQVLHTLMKTGLNAAFYVPADESGEWEVYTPN